MYDSFLTRRYFFNKNDPKGDREGREKENEKTFLDFRHCHTSSVTRNFSPRYIYVLYISFKYLASSIFFLSFFFFFFNQSLSYLFVPYVHDVMRLSLSLSQVSL